MEVKLKNPAVTYQIAVLGVLFLVLFLLNGSHFAGIPNNNGIILNFLYGVVGCALVYNLGTDKVLMTDEDSYIYFVPTTLVYILGSIFKCISIRLTTTPTEQFISEMFIEMVVLSLLNIFMIACGVLILKKGLGMIENE